jgi:hypothetical protein
MLTERLGLQMVGRDIRAPSACALPILDAHTNASGDNIGSLIALSSLQTLAC